MYIYIYIYIYIYVYTLSIYIYIYIGVHSGGPAEERRHKLAVRGPRRLRSLGRRRAGSWTLAKAARSVRGLLLTQGELLLLFHWARRPGDQEADKLRPGAHRGRDSVKQLNPMLLI